MLFGMKKKKGLCPKFPFFFIPKLIMIMVNIGMKNKKGLCPKFPLLLNVK